jgi:CDP-diacylglycerol--glycerol-3-phosphate 3-phosphatidyltransferase
VALVVLLYQKDLDGFGLFHVGEVLLAFAAVLTIWSGVVYVLAAWPVLRGVRPETKTGAEQLPSSEHPV